MMATTFSAHTSKYADRQFAACPLRCDADGIAKVPLDDKYPRFRPADNTKHDWDRADGLGIVLGRPSGNLAVIDVDDLGLSEWLLSRIEERAGAAPLMVTTARGRLHVYVTEPTPSRPVDLEVQYQGRRCLVQLLAAACQVAAPPTPGYSWRNQDAEPLYGPISDVWRGLALEYGLYYREAQPWSFLRRERSQGPTTAQIREGLRDSR